MYQTLKAEGCSAVTRPPTEHETSGYESTSLRTAVPPRALHGKTRVNHFLRRQLQPRAMQTGQFEMMCTASSDSQLGGGALCSVISI